MSIMEGFCIVAIDLGFIFIPLCVLTVFAEETKLGRKLIDWILVKLGGWDPEWDDEDDK